MKEKTTYTVGDQDGEIEFSINAKTRENLEAKGVDVDAEVRGIVNDLDAKLTNHSKLDETRDNREFLKE